MTDFAAARANMIEGQLRPNKITDPRLLDALAAVPREAFVPPASRAVAYADGEVAVGRARSLMAPLVLARMVEEAAVRPSDVVLDLAGATGYSAALLSHLAATVVAVEPDAALVETARSVFSELGAANVEVVNGPAEAGYPRHAPYDVIVINGAVERIPVALFDQLAEGGRLLAAEVGDDGLGRVRVHLKVAGSVSSRVLFEARPVEAPGFQIAREFVF
jgi:protein-L-isoaspartate(D-aspartate) O-methyltransferase